MSADIELRSYRRGDLEAMYQLDIQCFEPPFRFSRRAMRNFAEAPEAVTVLGDAGTMLAGFAIAEVAQSAGYIVTLDVHPEWRGRGLARTLLRELEEGSRKKGSAMLLLHVYAHNARAIALYEGQAYERTGFTADFYGRGLNALTYEKKL